MLSINGSVSALRFFFTETVDRLGLSRRLVLARFPRKLPSGAECRGSRPAALGGTGHDTERRA
jgi:hypothetical protein